jgi:integrase
MPAQRIHVWVQHFKDRENLVLQWIDPATGDRKSESAQTSDPKIAEQRRSDLEADLNAGRWKPKLRGKKAAEGRLSWEAFRKLFEAEYLADQRSNTRRLYAWTFSLFEKLAKITWLDEVNTRALSTFHGALMTARPRKRKGEVGYAPSTRHLVFEHLGAALAWAKEQELIKALPKVPEVGVPEPLPRPVPAESVERLLDATGDDLQMRGFLLCGWLAGLRLGEAFRLEWEENERHPYLDPAGEQIVFPAAFSKSKREEWIPLDPKLLAALEQLPRQGKRVFRFLSAEGRPIQLHGVHNRIKALAHRAGVRLGMHALRKGYGCRYAARVPAQVLQKLMRHGDIKITMRFYANVDDAVRKAVLGCKEENRPASQVEKEAAE